MVIIDRWSLCRNTVNNDHLVKWSLCTRFLTKSACQISWAKPTFYKVCGSCKQLNEVSRSGKALHKVRKICEQLYEVCRICQQLYKVRGTHKQLL